MLRSVSKILVLAVSALLVLAGVAFAQEPVPNPDDLASYEQWVEEHRDELPDLCEAFDGEWNVERETCEFDPLTAVGQQTEPPAPEPVVPAEPATPTPGAPTYTG